MYLGKKGGGARGRQRRRGRARTATSASPAPEDAEYVVWVVDHLGKGGPDYVYRIEVTPGRAEAACSRPTPSRSRWAPGSWPSSVPKGNRLAILILRQPGRLRRRPEPGRRAACRRRDDGGPADGGQPGRRAGALHGQPDAPLGGDAGQPVGQAGRSQAEGPLASSARPRRWCSARTTSIVWSRIGRPLAVAVTEECPYTIEIVEPKVPLVRGGSMGLKVGANRKAGFKAPIVGLPALESAGRRLGGRHRDPGGAERGRHSAERRRRGRAADLEDRGHRRLGRAPAGRSWSPRNWPT